MIQTLAFNARLPVLLGASPYYQTPSAPISRGLLLTEEDYVKARLTAMAVETEEFHREDIYTLFVTTRIINFLKGLPLEASVDLTDLFEREWNEARTQAGFDLLKQFAETQRLYFWSKQGLVKNRHFNSAIFLRVLSQAEIIACQNGESIYVKDWASIPDQQPPPSIAPSGLTVSTDP